MVSNSTMILLLFVGFCLYFDSSNAYKFNVGGRDGWVLHPSEDYSHWSHRLRFIVNDTLYFEYKKGEDSVLQVTESEFYKCNTTNPILKMEDGSSEFKLARSGPFFFISGVKENCEKGQRLLVVVLSKHHHRSPASHPPSISPSPSTPFAHPPAKSPSHSPLASPPTTSPSPQSAPIHHPTAPPPSPKVSPTPAPASPSPSVSPAPASPSPSVSPAPASPSPKASAAPIAFPPMADEEVSPAPAPSKNSAAKIVMGLPVAIALMACSIGLI